MGQRPTLEGGSYLAHQEVPYVLWKQKVLYRVHKSPTCVPVLSQISWYPCPLLQLKIKIGCNIINPFFEL